MYMDLLSKLEKYANENFVPMHMPGGKRNSDMLSMSNPYGIDITEISGFDNMHDANDIIKNGFERAAKLFGADESLFLVNGSTAGILAAICGITNKNDKIIVARNCHISVYNAIVLNELNPVYIIPEVDEETGIFKGITCDMIKACYKANTDVKAVIVTSPTYEGNISQIKEIAAYLHERNIPLIVDEAHGAHFNFHEAFPKSAIDCGADIVINSIHKTLPALTQTALMHLNGNLIDKDRVKRYWNIYQTTSPSYILLGSIDRCLSIIENKEIFDNYTFRLLNLRERLNKLNNIKLVETDDISKIILKCSDGNKLLNILNEKYHIQLEMASFKYVIAMTSVADKDEYYDRFANALEEIDREFDIENMQIILEKIGHFNMAIRPCDAFTKYDIEGGEEISIFSDAIYGKISVAPVIIYPPGIPVVNSGEIFSEDNVMIIRNAINSKLEVIGLLNGNILCLK